MGARGLCEGGSDVTEDDDFREELEVTKRLKTKAVVSDQDDFLREIAGSASH